MNTNNFKPLPLLSTFLASILALNAAPDCCPDGEAFDVEHRGNRMESSVELNETIRHNIGLKTAPVGHGHLDRTLNVLGEIVSIPENESYLSSRVAGRVTEVLVREGQRVEQGQVMLRLESLQMGSPLIELKAPATGTLSELRVRRGQPIQPDQRLAFIVDYSELYVVARIPGPQGSVLRSRPSARVTVASIPDSILQADFERRGERADPERHTLDAYFRLANHNDELRPGMRARIAVILESDTSRHYTLILRQALLGEHGNYFSYLVDDENPNLFHPVHLRVLGQDDLFAAVEGPIRSGQTVVSQGGHALRYAGAVAQAQLREASDAAHGHSHDHDHGEESHAGIPSHDHEHDHYLVYALSGSSVLLLGIVLLQTLRMRRYQTQTEPVENEQ